MDWDLKSFGNKALIVLGLWIVIILLISSISLFSTMQEGIPVNVPEIIFYEFLCITPWIILTPLIIRLARSYRFETDRLYRSVVVHFTMIIVVFSLHTVIQSYVVSVQYGIEFTWAYLQRDFLGFIDMRVMLYTGILLAAYSIDFYKKSRIIQLREMRLKAALNRAKFRALLNQIQPDFLLKTIDSIKNSLSHDPETSETILTDFSDLLRVMLNNADREMIAIHEDLKTYDLYVNILQKRLGHTIQKKTDIEIKCYDALIPSFLLMIPLIEEIIHSGDARTNYIKSLSYDARKSGEKVHLQSALAGRNLPIQDISELYRKAGVRETISRLQQIYGSDIQLRTRTGKDVIYVNLTVPYRVAKEDNRPIWATEIEMDKAE